MLLVTLAASVATVDLCPTDGCADFSSDASLHSSCHQTGFTSTNHFASNVYMDGDEPYVLAVRLVHAGADYRFLYCTRRLSGGFWTHRVSGTVLDYEPYAPVVDDDVFPMIRRQRFRVVSSDVFSCPSNFEVLCGSSSRTLTAVVTFLVDNGNTEFSGQFRYEYRALVDNVDLNLNTGGTLESRRVHELGKCNSHLNICTDGFNAAISPSGVHVAVVKPTLSFPGSFSSVRANTAGFTLYTSTSYGRKYEGSNNDKRHGDLFHNELEFSPDTLPFLSSRIFAPLAAVDVAFESEDGAAANYLVWFRKYARLFKHAGHDAMDRDNYDFAAALGSGYVSSNKLRSSEDIDDHSDNMLRIAYPIVAVGSPTRTKHNTATQLTAFYRFDHGAYGRYEFDGLQNGFPAMFQDLVQFYLARGDHHNGVTTGGVDFKGANGGLVSTARYVGSAWQSTAYAWHRQYYAEEPSAPETIRPAPSEEFLATALSPFFQKRLILVGRFSGSKICSIVPTRAMLGTDGKRPAIAECTTDGFSDYSLHVANYAAEPTTTVTTRTATTATTVTTTTVTIVAPSVKCAEAGRFELNSAAVASLRTLLLNDDPANTDIDLVKQQAGGSFFFLEFTSLLNCNEAAAEMNRVFCLRGPQTLECPSSNNIAPILRYRDCGAEAFESNYTAMTSGVCPSTSSTTTTVTTTTEANCTIFDGFFVNKATNRCEQCPEGTYVPTTDERFNINFDSCFEQRGCAVGHIELVPGTSVHPPICGDPHDSQHCNATTEFHIGNLTNEGGEWRMKCAVAGTCPFETDVANVEEGTIENAVARYAEAVIDRADFESLRQFGSTHAGANHNVTVDGHTDVHFIRLCEPLTVCEPFNPDPPPEIGVFNTYEAVPPRPDADRICLPCPSLCANESSADFPSIAGEFTPTRDVCTFSTTQNAKTCNITADSETGFFGFGGRACSAIKSDPRHPGGFCRDHEARTITTSTKTTATLTTSRPNPCNAGRFRSIDGGCHDCAPGRYTPFDGRDYFSCLERRRCKVEAGREAEELKGPVVSPRRIVHDGGRLNYLCERPLNASCAENEFQVSVQEEAGGELLKLCQVVRRCYPGQYVSKQPTATSDRECRNCTLCRSYTSTYNADRCIEIEQPTTPGYERSGCRLDTPFASVGPPTTTTATSTTATATTMVAKFMMTVAARFPVDPRDDNRTECDVESPHAKTVLRQKAATAFEVWALKSGAPFPVVASVVLTCEPGIIEFTFFVRNPASEFPAFAAAATSPASPQLYVDHSGLLDSELYAETITVTNVGSKSVATATRNIVAPPKVSKFKKANEGLAWVGFAALGLFVAGVAVLYVQLRDGQRAMLVKTFKSSFV